MDGFENRIILPDSQAPFHHPRYIEFTQRVAKEFKCKKASHIGDLFDFRFLSSHSKRPDPDDPLSPRDEYKRSIEFAKELFSKLPVEEICQSNHELRVWKRAKEQGLPSFLLKDYIEILKLPKYVRVVNAISHYGGRVVLEHGHRVKGSSWNAYLAHLNSNGVSTIIGHHSFSAGIIYKSNWSADKYKRAQRFFMNVGCLVDEHSWGMEWCKDFTNRMVMGCGVLTWDKKRKLVIPHFIPLD